MELIEIKTLVDITNTGVIRPNQGTPLELDQNRNFITLMQCIGIKSIVHYESTPSMEKIDIKSLGFGTAYKGKHSVWTFGITPDRDEVYLDPTGNAVGLLINDLHQVPIIKTLTETINISIPIFDLKNSQYKNTVITFIQN
jgi:hypothetical protein